MRSGRTVLSTVFSSVAAVNTRSLNSSATGASAVHSFQIVFRTLLRVANADEFRASAAITSVSFDSNNLFVGLTTRLVDGFTLVVTLIFDTFVVQAALIARVSDQ